VTGSLALWVLGIIVASALFGLCAPGVGRRAPARTATWLLSVGSLLVGASAVVVTALVGLFVLGQVPSLAAQGGWSPGSLARWVPVHGPAALIPLVVTAAQVAVVSRTAMRGGRILVRAWRANCNFDTALVVIPGADPVAFALPGWPGRVVASRGLLRILDGVERRAVLAHEQAHLDQRHDLHRAAAALAVAANPLLRPVPAALRLATERWADEAAAAVIGDRLRVAATIARVAGLPAGPSVRPSTAMAATDADVALRVNSLLAAPRRRASWELLLLLVAVAAVATALTGVYDTKHMFEAAEQAYLHARWRQ
jgi:hypothetical protein